MTTKMRRVIPLDRAEALAMAQRHPGMPGICGQCGCSQFSACMDLDSGVPCHWANRAQTLCSAALCQARARGPEKMRGIV